jgi:hypothetical protein
MIKVSALLLEIKLFRSDCMWFSLLLFWLFVLKLHCCWWCCIHKFTWSLSCIYSQSLSLTVLCWLHITLLKTRNCQDSLVFHTETTNCHTIRYCQMFLSKTFPRYFTNTDWRKSNNHSSITHRSHHYQFSWLDFNIKLWPLGMNHVECWKLSTVSANIAVAIIRVNMCWLDVTWKLYVV